MIAPTLPSTFLAVQGIGPNTSRMPQLMNALRALPAIATSSPVTRPAPVGLPMPAMRDGGLLKYYGGGQATFSFLEDTPAGPTTDPGAPAVDMGGLIQTYLDTFGKSNPDVMNAGSMAEAWKAAATALQNSPALVRQVQSAQAAQERLNAAAGNTAASNHDSLAAAQLQTGFDYANMGNTNEQNQLTREQALAIEASQSGDRRAIAEQVAANNREQMILEWHKAQLAAEDNARTAAETAQRDKQAAFLGLLPYGHQPGFDPMQYHFGDPTTPYSVTAPAFVTPSAGNSQIAQPNVPAISWPAPAGP